MVNLVLLKQKNDLVPKFIKKNITATFCC